LDREKIKERLSGLRILIIGDLILDHYLTGEVNRISPEGPIPVVELKEEEYAPGGAANVAMNCREIGLNASLMGAVGGWDDSGRKLIERLLHNCIGFHFVEQDDYRKTTTKTRIRTKQQQIVRVDSEEIKAMSEKTLQWMFKDLRRSIDNFDAIIVTDYNKGVINDRLLKEVCSIAKQYKKIITIDPKNDRLNYSHGFTAVCPNLKEAEILTGVKIKNYSHLTKYEAILETSKILHAKFNCEASLITAGSDGIYLLEAGRDEVQIIPACARQVYDVSGAGDTVISVLTAFLLIGYNFTDATTIANIAGGLVVEKMGTATVTIDELMDRSQQINGDGMEDKTC